MSKFNEPEEMEFNPLGESVNEKSYTRPNVNISQDDLDAPIPEPMFTPPNISSNDGTNGQPKKEKNYEQFNPKMEELPKKDKKEGARYVAETIVGIYSFLWEMANKSILFNENKLAKLEADGEIDLNMMLPVGDGQVVTIREFAEEYNRQNDGALKVSQEFMDEVLPVLTQILEKRGIGMTPEQKVLYLFAKDSIQKGLVLYQMMGIQREMLKFWREEKLTRSGGSPTTPPPPTTQQPITPTPPPPPPSPIVMDEEAIVEEYYEQEEVNDFEESLKVNNIVEEMVNPQPKGKRGRPKK